MDAFRSVPAKIASRLVLVGTSLAWCLIGVIVLILAIQAIFDSKDALYKFTEQILDGDATGVLLATLSMYVVIVGFRVLWRLVRPSLGPDEPFWLKALDEMGFPAWSMISAGKRFFAPLNFFLTLPLRYILSTQRRALNFFIAFAVLASITFVIGLISRIALPMRTLRWGNQWGSGVRAFGTSTWLLWAALIAVIIVILLLVVYAGIIVQSMWNATPFLILTLAFEDYGIRLTDWTVGIIMWTPAIVESLNVPSSRESDFLAAFRPALYELLHFGTGIYTDRGDRVSLLGVLLLGLIVSIIPMTIRRISMLPKVDVVHHSRADFSRDVQRYTLQEESAEIVNKVALHDSRPAYVVIATISLACMSIGYLSPLYTSALNAVGLVIMLGLPATAVFIVNQVTRPRFRSELMNQDGILIWEARALGRQEEDPKALY